MSTYLCLEKWRLAPPMLYSGGARIWNQGSPSQKFYMQYDKKFYMQYGKFEKEKRCKWL
jgi:hypothetical protein